MSAAWYWIPGFGPALVETVHVHGTDYMRWEQQGARCLRRAQDFLGSRMDQVDWAGVLETMSTPRIPGRWAGRGRVEVERQIREGLPEEAAWAYSQAPRGRCRLMLRASLLRLWAHGPAELQAEARRVLGEVADRAEPMHALVPVAGCR